MKVWGINVFRRVDDRSVQCRAVVASPSKKAAAAALDVSLHYFNGYGAVTGNAAELSAALADPGVVFFRPLSEDHRDDAPWRRQG